MKMDCFYAAAITAKLLPIYYMALLTADLLQSSTARELRPSYHGLAYYYQQQQQQQSTSPRSPAAVGKRPSQEMKSFFNAPPSQKSSTSSAASPSVGLPRAMNTSDEAWWRSVSGWRSEDRVRKGLLIGSLVCGIAGTVLLVGCCAVYVVKRRAMRVSEAALTAGFSSTANSTPNNNNNNNVSSSLAIVPKLNDLKENPSK